MKKGKSTKQTKLIKTDPLECMNGKAIYTRKDMKDELFSGICIGLCLGLSLPILLLGILGTLLNITH